MAMPVRKHRYTVDEVLAIPWDGNRREVIDGDLFVTPAPALLHQRAVNELLSLLRDYARQIGGEAFASPSDIVLTDAALVQPDLFVVPRQAGVRLTAWSQVATLLLAVEVLSPRTARRDRTVKRALYQAQHVPEYWVVDIVARVIDRWRPDSSESELLRDALRWQPVPAREPLSIDLVAYFRNVLEE